MMLLDVDYLLLGTPGVLAAVWAWRRSSTLRARASQRQAASGLSGREAAHAVLRAANGPPVPIDIGSGPLANHYDSCQRRLRLSEEVSFGHSLNAIGTASHEAGHALQQADHSPWSPVRRALIPLAALGSILAWLLVLAGTTLGMFRLIVWGLAAFSATVLLQLVALGAELDASRRGMEALIQAELVDPAERVALSEAQDAAAWSSVATVLTGFPSLLAHTASALVRGPSLGS